MKISSLVFRISLKKYLNLAKSGSFFLVIFISMLSLRQAKADVSITPANNVNIFTCSGLWYNLSNIVLTEGATNDIALGTNVTFNLTLPAGFEFNTGVGSVTKTESAGGGNDITSIALSYTSNQIVTITMTVGATSKTNSITISGLQVRLNSTVPTIGQITRGGGTPWGGSATIAGAVVGGLTYGNLASYAFPNANAGQDQFVCGTTANLDAVLPPNVTGQWTVVSGTGSFSNASSPTSGVSGLSAGDNVFRWTLRGTADPTNCTSSALVYITSLAGSGGSCTNPDNQFSRVTNISPAMGSQDNLCPNQAGATGVQTQFTLANAGPFNVGDKVLIIQMGGASVNTAAASNDVPNAADDAAFGTITNYNGAGNYEFAIIATKVGSVVTFASNLLNQYNVDGYVQLVTVPQFLTRSITGTYRGTSWDVASGTGGVMVFEVTGTLTLSGTIEMSHRGFVGGLNNRITGATDVSNPGPGNNCLIYCVSTCGNGTARCGMGLYSSATCQRSTSQRGQGIAYNSNHLFGRGSFANAAGGGGGWNAGGGGGGNAGAGGRGGAEYNKCYNSNTDLTYNTGIGALATGAAERAFGIGGRALVQTNRAFMGGGGGAANGDGGNGTAGGNGGGIIIIKAGTLAGSNGVIRANGQNGFDNGGLNGSPYTGNDDGVGGGGAGGSILLEIDNYSVTNLTIEAKGGRGGINAQQSSCHGIGGGGGGGLVRHNGMSSNATMVVTGGNRGTHSMNTGAVCYPLSWNAQGGVSGTTQQAAVVIPQKACCSPADLGPSPRTLCGVGSITLSHGTASTTNKYFRWYRNGTLVQQGAGASFSTYNATTAGSYSVSIDSTNAAGTILFCTVQDAVIVTNSFPAPDLGADQQLCSPSYLDLTPNNAGSYPAGSTWEWRKDGVVIPGATGPVLYNVREAGTYTVTITASGGCGPVSDDIVLTTAMPVTVDDCRSTAGVVNLSVSGGMGGPYNWYATPTSSTALATDSPTYSPSVSTTTTFYVQDNGNFTATYGLSPGGHSGQNAPGNGSIDHQQLFQVHTAFSLIGITVVHSQTSTGTVSINIRSSDISGTVGAIVATRSITGVSTTTGGSYAFDFSSNPIALSPGYYIIEPNAGVSIYRRDYSSDIHPATYSDNLLGPMFTTIRTRDNGGFPNNVRRTSFFNWRISYPKPCERVPVVAQIGGCAMPVEWLNFSASAENSNVHLNWSTALEVQNSYFVVQRSLDGQLFNTIGKVNGQGTSNTISSYSYTDFGVPGGRLYYKLIQVNEDGSVSASKIVSVYNADAFEVSVYPNPFAENFTLLISSSEANSFNVKVYSVTGFVYFNQELLSNEEILLGAELPKGLFILEINGQNSNKVIRLLKNF